MNQKQRKFLKKALRGRSTKRVSWVHHQINSSVALEKRLKSNTVDGVIVFRLTGSDCDGTGYDKQRTMITPCLTKARQMEEVVYDYDGYIRAEWHQPRKFDSVGRELV